MKKSLLLGALSLSLSFFLPHTSNATGLIRAANSTDISMDIACSNIPSSVNDAYLAAVQTTVGSLSTGLVSTLNNLAAVTSTTSPGAIPPSPTSWYSIPQLGLTGFRKANIASPSSTFAASEWTAFYPASFAVSSYYNSRAYTGVALSSTISSLTALANILGPLNSWTSGATNTTIGLGSWSDLQQNGGLCTFTINDPVPTNQTQASNTTLFVRFNVATY